MRHCRRRAPEPPTPTATEPDALPAAETAAVTFMPPLPPPPPRLCARIAGRVRAARDGVAVERGVHERAVAARRRRHRRCRRPRRPLPRRAPVIVPETLKPPLPPPPPMLCATNAFEPMPSVSMLPLTVAVTTLPWLATPASPPDADRHRARRLRRRAAIVPETLMPPLPPPPPMLCATTASASMPAVAASPFSVTVDAFAPCRRRRPRHRHRRTRRPRRRRRPRSSPTR